MTMKMGTLNGNECFEHDGWTGSVEWSEEDGLYYGKLLNTSDLVTYHGETMEDCYRSFCEAIDDYFVFCKEVRKC